MLHDRFVTSDVVEHFIRSLEPQVREVLLVEHGNDNIIAIVDRQRVFRFPRHEAAANRQRYEAQLLKLLRGRVTLPIPEVLEEHFEPDYLITTLLPGQHLRVEEMRALSPAHISLFAEQIAQFMEELNAALTPQSVLRLQTDLNVHEHAGESWESFFMRTLGQGTYPGRPWLEQLGRRYFTDWQQTCNSNLSLNMVVHDDLHLENILFANNRISGILDFGETAVGTAAEEMRTLLVVGPQMVRATAQAYQARTGMRVRELEVITWAVTAALASYCERLAKGEVQHPSFVRAQQNLREWLPDFATVL